MSNPDWEAGMKFADSVAAMLAYQKLTEQMKPLFQQLSVALAEIPESLRSAAVQEVIEMAARWEAEARKFIPASSEPVGVSRSADAGGSNLAAALPSASLAILQLLDGHKDGLTADQIQKALKGRFQTAAARPERVIATTLTQLRGDAKLLHDNGRYSLSPSAGAVAKGGLTLKQRVAEYFRQNGNTPATSLDLAKAVGVHPNAIRSLFSVSAPTFVIAEGSDSKPNTMKFWKLRDDLFGSLQMLKEET